MCIFRNNVVLYNNIINGLDRKEYRKKYYQENKERELAKHKEWNKNHPEYYKKYQQEHKEYLVEYYKKYCREHKEHIKENMKKNYQENKEYYIEYQKQYSKTEKGKASNQRERSKRRARIKEIINTLIYQEWLDILEEHNYICAYCGVEFDCENLPTRDHIIPLNKGGDNTKDNIVPACKSCNSKKHDKIINIAKEIIQCVGA